MPHFFVPIGQLASAIVRPELADGEGRTDMAADGSRSSGPDSEKRRPTSEFPASISEMLRPISELGAAFAHLAAPVPNGRDAFSPFTSPLF